MAPPSTSDGSSNGALPPTRPMGGYVRRQFMAVKIPVVADVDDSFHQREDRIDEALKAKGLGTVLGWGDSLGDTQAGGSRRVAYTRVDLDVVDIDATRAELRAVLPIVGAPSGTEIHYEQDGKRLVDIYAPPDWQFAQPAVQAPRRK